MIQTITTSTAPSSPHYAQRTLGSGSLLAVGGQNGVTADGTLLDGVAAQSEQAITNVLAVLNAAGADQTNVLRLRMLVRSRRDGVTRTVRGGVSGLPQ